MPHSPAPWTLSPDGEITAADGTVIIYTENGYFRLAEDNASLVTAAPDLLQAILNALPILRAQAHRFPAPEWDNMNRAFREAVAKATAKA